MIEHWIVYGIYHSPWPRENISSLRNSVQPFSELYWWSFSFCFGLRLFVFAALVQVSWLCRDSKGQIRVSPCFHREIGPPVHFCICHASWPTSFCIFSCLHIPSPEHRDYRLCHCIQPYMGARDLNSGPQAWIASALLTDASACLISVF